MACSRSACLGWIYRARHGGKRDTVSQGMGVSGRATERVALGPSETIVHALVGGGGGKVLGALRRWVWNLDWGTFCQGRRHLIQPGLYVETRPERNISLGHDSCPPPNTHSPGLILVVGRGTSWLFWFEEAGKASGAKIWALGQDTEECRSRGMLGGRVSGTGGIGSRRGLQGQCDMG